MSDDARVQLYRPPLETIFEEYLDTITYCGKQKQPYGFSAMMLALSVIEAIGFFVTAEKDKNRPCFRKGLRYFPKRYRDRAVEEKLWSQARNCLVHDLTVCGGVSVTWKPDLVDKHLQEDAQGILYISMIELTKDLRKATDDYLQDRKSNPSLQKKFQDAIEKVENM